MAIFSNKKSGDSKQQDAERAQAAPAAEAGVNPESIVEVLQGAGEELKREGASAEKVALLERQLESLVKIVENMSKQRAAPPQSVTTVSPSVSGVRAYMTCPQCGQYTTVCNGNHVQANIMAPSSEHSKNFPGVRWNGVTYIGRCFIPRACAQDIIATVKFWEFGERVLAFGREKVVDTGNPRRQLGSLFVYDRDVPTAQ